MRRQKADKSEWDPRPSDRVCSDHFVNKIPTTEHPDPTLSLDYTCSSTKSRRQLVYQQPILKQKRKYSSTETPVSCEASLSASITDHNYSLSSVDQRCMACINKNCVIQSMAKKKNAFSLENKKFKSNQILSKKVIPFTWQRIKSNEKMNLYTGISSIDIFLAVFKLNEPYLPKVKYWVGTKRITSTKYELFADRSLKS